MIVVSRNKGGAYIVCDLDGTLAHAPIAAFRVLPYFAREILILPDLEQHLDVSVARLRELERSTAPDPDNPQSNTDAPAIQSEAADAPRMQRYDGSDSDDE